MAVGFADTTATRAHWPHHKNIQPPYCFRGGRGGFANGTSLFYNIDASSTGPCNKYPGVPSNKDPRACLCRTDQSWYLYSLLFTSKFVTLSSPQSPAHGAHGDLGAHVPSHVAQVARLAQDQRLDRRTVALIVLDHPPAQLYAIQITAQVSWSVSFLPINNRNLSP